MRLCLKKSTLYRKWLALEIHLSEVLASEEFSLWGSELLSLPEFHHMKPGAGEPRNVHHKHRNLFIYFCWLLLDVLLVLTVKWIGIKNTKDQNSSVWFWYIEEYVAYIIFLYDNYVTTNMQLLMLYINTIKVQ
jgi:hypothetical protein